MGGTLIYTVSYMTLATRLKKHVPAIVILCVAFCAQAFLLTRDIGFLVANVLPDDAFYYFEIAKNISLGLGSTFDGITQTNGYHPLWMLILTPVYSFTQAFAVGDVAPIRLALGISAFFFLFAGIYVYRLLRTLTQNSYLLSAGMLVFSLNPFLLYETINGLETSLSLFLASVLFYTVVTMSEKPNVRTLVTMGALSALVILSRLDLIFYVGAIGLWFLLRSVRQATVFGVTVAVCILPFFAWNFFTYGTFLTSASGANELVNHTLIVQDHGGGMYQTAKAAFYNLHGQLRDLMIHTGAPEVTLLFIGAGLVLFVLRREHIPRKIAEISPWHLLVAGFALLFVLNVMVRFTARTWYFVTFSILFALLVVWVLRTVDTLTTFEKKGKTLLFALLIAWVGMSFFVWWHKELREQFALQREMLAASAWFNEHVAPDTRIGVFNAGVQGYFTEATVINLDGLVNNEAYRAMKEKKLFSYMKRAGITYVSDFDIYLDYRYKSFFDVSSIRDHLEHIEDIQLVESTKSTRGISMYRFVP